LAFIGLGRSWIGCFEEVEVDGRRLRYGLGSKDGKFLDSNFD
jgi:hypothetical protein